MVGTRDFRAVAGPVEIVLATECACAHAASALFAVLEMTADFRG